MYGPVRTVVWQGSAGDRRPYADQAELGELLNGVEDFGEFLDDRVGGVYDSVNGTAVSDVDLRDRRH